MPMGIGGAAAEGIRSGFQLGLESDAATEHRREFDAEQASRDEAQRRLAKQEDDRYGRMNDAARVSAAEARLATLEKLAKDAAAAGHPLDHNSPMMQERARLAVQLEDMQGQIASTGRLAPSSGMGTGVTSPAPMPTAMPASGTGMPTAPTAPPVNQGAAQQAVAPPADSGIPSQVSGTGLGPSRGPAGGAAPLDTSMGGDVAGAPPAPAIAGGAPAAAAVASPTTSAVTPAQKLVADTDQHVQNLSSKLSAGQLNFDDVAPGDFALMVASATKRSPTDISQVRQHINDWQAGMQTGNNGLTIQGLNGIFGPQLSLGVGSPSAYGGTITGKSIVGLDPAMSADGSIHPDKVIPRLQITTDVKGPDGQPLTYHAPMTQNRSSSPDDPVTAVSVGDTVNHIGALGTLLTAASHPDMQAKLQEGAADPRVQAYLDAYQNQTDAGNPAIVKESQIQNYMRSAGVDRDTAVERMIALGVLPRPPMTKGVVGQTMDAAYGMVADGTAPDLPSALAMLQRAGVTKQPTKYSPGARAAGGTGAPGAVAAPPPAGTVNLVTGSAVLPAPDRNGLIMGLTPRAIDDAAWVYADTQKLPTGMSRSKDSDPMKKMLMNRAGELMERAGITPEQYAAGSSQFKADAKSLALQQTRADAIDLGMEKIKNDIGTIQSTIANGNIDFGPWLSKPINALRTQSGSPSLAAYSLAVQQVAIEYERMLNGGQMSVAQLHQGAQEDAHKILNSDMNVATVNAVLPVMLREMNNARSATHSQLATVRNRMSTHGSAPAGGTGLSAPTAAPAAAPAGSPVPTAADLAYAKAHPEVAAQFRAHFGVDPQ